MRRLINIVESVSETYSRQNLQLLRFLKERDFDPYAYWWWISRWIIDNDRVVTLSDILQTELDDEDVGDLDPEVFFRLPQELQREIADDVSERLMQASPSDAPTWKHMDLNRDRLLHRQEWLIHFSDHAESIAQSGFKHGVDDMSRLALTTWMSDGDKLDGGYNFAFKATSRYALSAASRGTYGKHAVLFRSSGVEAYHYGDEEDQVMFWGEDVEPHDVVLLRRDYDEWKVIARSAKREVVFSGSFEDAVKWVIANFDRYRRALTGR